MRRSPDLQAKYIAATLQSFAGSTQWVAVLFALAALLLFSWFTDRLWDVIAAQEWSVAVQWFVIIGFPVLLAFMLRKTRAMTKDIIPEVECELVDRESVQRVGCLILFLSPPGKDKEQLQQWLDDANLKGSLNTRLAEMQGAWRMPFEAIALHSGRLKQVAVVCSSDMETKQDGTWRNFELFRKIIHHLLGTEEVNIFNAMKQLEDKDGVDFENADELVKLVNGVYRRFDELHHKDSDILVDITGGQKVPTIAGAAIALAEGRRFQYVSTRDYKVRLYNVTYKTV
jgi:hypothetical protein